MCTAITFHTNAHYFGRTLDLEHTYNETVTVTPRNFPLSFRAAPPLASHYAMIGTATVADGYPLYYEAANEHGLAAAALNFPHSAQYAAPCAQKNNVAPFELIPWLLAQCKDLAEARARLAELCLCRMDFNAQLPCTPLHWLVADRNGAVTVESTVHGLQIFENSVGVLTNEPCFSYHMTRLCDCMSLSPYPPENRLGLAPFELYSRGLGAVGLPGDFSSVSRFLRAVFVKQHAVCGIDEAESVGQFFHMLDTVAPPRGSVRLADGRCVITVYSACINTDSGVYYYTTHQNRGVSAVDMHRCDLNSTALYTYPLADSLHVERQN